MTRTSPRQGCQAGLEALSPSRVVLANLLEHARGATLGFLEEIPQTKYCWQPYRGANHVMWVLGHLAVTDRFAVEQLGRTGPDVPEGYQTLFGRGSTPVEDISVYPSIPLVFAVLEKQRESLLASISAMSDADLARPLSEDIRWYAVDGLALLFKLCWHEGMHAGQITAVRKSLGLGPWLM